MSNKNLASFNDDFPKLGTAVTKTKKQKKLTSSIPLSSLNPSNTNTKHATFPLFPLLPTELRLKIYDIVFQTPRIVKVKLRRLGSVAPNDEVNSVKFPKLGLEYLPGSSVPELLHVNQEAREEGLKVYKPCLEGGKKKQNTIYVHPRVDILLIRLPDKHSKVARQELVPLDFHLTDFNATEFNEGHWIGGMGLGCFCAQVGNVSNRFNGGNVLELAIMPMDSDGWKKKFRQDYGMMKGFRKLGAARVSPQGEMVSWEKECAQFLVEWQVACEVQDLTWRRSSQCSGVYGPRSR